MYTRKSEIKFLTNISDGFQRIENSFYLQSLINFLEFSMNQLEKS